MLTLGIVSVNNLITTEELKEDYVIDSNDKHNIERESQKGVVIHKLHEKIKMAE